MESHSSSNSPPHRTLIIQPLPGIGDMVWHLPFIQAIAEFEESKSVDILTIKRSMADQLFAHEKYVSDVLWLDDVFVGKSKLLDTLNLAKKLRALNYGRVWILHKNYHWALVAFLAGIPERWGYGFGWQRWFVNSGKYLSDDSQKLHPIDQAVEYLKLNGLLAEEVSPKIEVSDVLTAQIEARFKDYPKPWIALGIGATDSRRQWGADNFASLAKSVLEQWKGTVFLVGGAAEEAMANQLKAASSSVVNIISYPLNEVSALLKTCQLYVGNDSGMLHISAAVGTRSIGIYGMTYKKINTYRLADEARNIYGVFPDEKSGEVGVSSMHGISVVSVMLKAQKLLES